MGFAEKGNCVIPTQKVDHCLKYNKNGVCKECQFNYGVVKGKCQKITIPKCLRTINDDFNACEICDDGILPVNGNCTDKSQKCSEEDCDYCEIFGDLEVCSYCKKGFVLFIENLQNEDPLFMCVEDKYGLENCENSVSIGECNECKLNYYMDDEGKCIRSRSYE